MVVAGFVAPYLLDTTTRFAEAAAGLPGTRLATLIADGMVIVRHPELPFATQMARRFAAELRLYAS